MASRQNNFSHSEDFRLCQTYISISQDAAVGKNQSRKIFWERVAAVYNAANGENDQVRTARSLHCRIQLIESHVRKLNGCVNQTELLQISGASEQDILDRAKILFSEDQSAKFKMGFRFDHVWRLCKDFEKFKDHVPKERRNFQNQSINLTSSESENPTSEYHPSNSPGLSSFSLDLNDDEVGGSSSKRPMGVKKTKLKRRLDAENDDTLNKVKADNKELLELLKRSAFEREIQMDLQRQNIEMQRKREEDRRVQIQMQRQNLEMQQRRDEMQQKRDEDMMLLVDLNSILDPQVRSHIQENQRLIIQRRSTRQQPQPPPSSSYMPGFEFLNQFNDNRDNFPDF